MNWKTGVLCALAGLALGARAGAQTWGLGATYGSVNDVNDGVTFEGFKPSEYTIYAEYRMEKNTLLRGTYGSIWTEQGFSGDEVGTPSGPGVVPAAKERIHYGTVDVSYQFWEGFFTSGLFAGVGFYNFNPQPMPPDYAAYQDADESVFGWNAGVDGEFRVMNHLAIVLRLSYHNVAAHPHRQFFNADAGLVARF